jgi:hypothetical protein
MVRITYSQFERAVSDVRSELRALGILSESSRLNKPDVIWCGLPQFYPLALGFCFESALSKKFMFDKIMGAIGYHAGNIYIPSFIFTLWKIKGSLRDIIRHEYAHAIAFHFLKLVKRCREFREAFGGTYNGLRIVDMPVESFVSGYAMKSPAEDFAECFM